MTIEEIKNKIQSGLPNSKVTILDPHKDGVHIKAIVVYEGFQGKSMLEQHRMVYATLKEELKQEVHALALETRIQE
ncbi:BolA/IbaG family iron-sulfur metabolism protein [Leptospira ellisii]|uniref:BolA family transcriptional regulator n=1 Tax=Leptospira ellisii TaxID=2023197 RepID=A0A2N0BQ57_9LEPT|nr:BolA/IbaG family iron-sulfur metabolism protein [Leptospira ellisii]MDV6234989.1 BolA/IbaG family iron-sulfur metabolism protein [Leptospira ellisii]PJZ92317.1 BolA family transcriptional regulator [Leptospira ellisii]PKA06121.1 BolA family transcriptional regulator [Leptospira ellisii]